MDGSIGWTLSKLCNKKNDSELQFINHCCGIRPHILSRPPWHHSHLTTLIFICHTVTRLSLHVHLSIFFSLLTCFQSHNNHFIYIHIHSHTQTLDICFNSFRRWWTTLEAVPLILKTVASGNKTVCCQ